MDALYVSSVTLATLGFGDIVPQARWLRVATPVEALMGFSLITAAISWVLQVYPALNRRRSLAARVDLLRQGGAAGRIDAGRSALVASQLGELADGLTGLRVDLTQNSETYYFRDGDAASALPALLGIVLELAARACRSGDAELQYAGSLLRVGHRGVPAGGGRAVPARRRLRAGPVGGLRRRPRPAAAVPWTDGRPSPGDAGALLAPAADGDGGPVLVGADGDQHAADRLVQAVDHRTGDGMAEVPGPGEVGRRSGVGARRMQGRRHERERAGQT